MALKVLVGQSKYPNKKVQDGDTFITFDIRE